MKKIVIASLILSTIVMTGCEDLPGVLTVTKAFNAVVKRKTKTIDVGQYKTSLDFKRNKVVAIIDTGSEKMKIELAVPDNAQIPSNGNFELSAAQTGQPFDVLGSVQTQVNESEMRSEYESCTYQTYDTICTPSGCHSVPVNRYGNRFIDYYVRDTNQKMDFDMTTSGDARSKLSHFAGAARYSEKIVTRESSCF